MSRTDFNTLLEAGAHFGHLKRKWNPKMAPYIFMEKNGIHIIDLHKTVLKIDEAAAPSSRSPRAVAACCSLPRKNKQRILLPKRWQPLVCLTSQSVGPAVC